MITSFYRIRPVVPVWHGSTQTDLPAQADLPDTPLQRDDWVIQARCRYGDPDALFVQGAHQQRQAAAICGPCRVWRHCLATALDNREEFGVWGGLTERQRRAVLRKNIHVANWADHLVASDENTGS